MKRIRQLNCWFDALSEGWQLLWTFLILVLLQIPATVADHYWNPLAGLLVFIVTTFLIVQLREWH